MKTHFHYTRGFKPISKNKTRGFKNKPEVFVISQEYPRFRLRPYKFIGFGCVGYMAYMECLGISDTSKHGTARKTSPNKL